MKGDHGEPHVPRLGLSVYFKEDGPAENQRLGCLGAARRGRQRPAGSTRLRRSPHDGHDAIHKKAVAGPGTALHKSRLLASCPDFSAGPLARGRLHGDGRTQTDDKRTEDGSPNSISVLYRPCVSCRTEYILTACLVWSGVCHFFHSLLHRRYSQMATLECLPRQP